MGKADKLEYGYNLERTTLSIDEYFEIPPRNRWSGAYMRIKIYLPENAVIYIDEDIEDILDDYLGNGVYAYEAGGKYWEMTEEGLEELK